MGEREIMISIIVPVYRVETWLSLCVRSVLVQNFDGFELILVDDGSDDNCPDICDRYAVLDGRVSVIHQENRGISSARNAGLKMASGEYVLFLDGDDTMLPGSLSRLASMAVNDPDIVISPLLYRRGKRIGHDPDYAGMCCGSKAFLEANISWAENGVQLPWQVSHLLIRRKFLTENNIRFDRKWTYCEDVEFYVSCMLQAEFWKVLDTPAVCYREGRPMSVMTTYSYKSLQYRLSVFCSLYRRACRESRLSGFRSYFADYFARALLAVPECNKGKERCYRYVCLNQDVLAATSERVRYKAARLVWRMFGIWVGTEILYRGKKLYKQFSGPGPD